MESSAEKNETIDGESESGSTDCAEDKQITLESITQEQDQETLQRRVTKAIWQMGCRDP